MKNLKNNQSGFTLIEILVVIGMIALLAAIVLIAINPARQFAQGRNTQRVSNTQTILNAIGQNIADNKGSFNCSIALPSATSTIGTGATCTGTCVDLRSCLAPTYTSEIPLDPQNGSITSATNYTTGYQVVQPVAGGRITVLAPSAELGQTISITR